MVLRGVSEMEMAWAKVSGDERGREGERERERGRVSCRRGHSERGRKTRQEGGDFEALTSDVTAQ
jgi:hypothetical protein